jgi:HlyD family secretion protein
VFVEEGGRARLRHVTLGQRDGISAAIDAGLADGERIVLHPSDRVGDGVRIAPRGT